MRSIIILHIIFLLLLSLQACRSKNEEKLPADIIHNPNTARQHTDAAGLPVMSFEKDEHDFGRVIQGEVVTYAFKFTNTGDADLLISSVSSSCGCTISKYNRDPINPGHEGTVQVTFDSKGRKGFQHKTITVMSNTQPSKNTLSIKARVVVPEE